MCFVSESLYCKTPHVVEVESGLMRERIAFAPIQGAPEVVVDENCVNVCTSVNSMGRQPYPFFPNAVTDPMDDEFHHACTVDLHLAPCGTPPVDAHYKERIRSS